MATYKQNNPIQVLSSYAVGLEQALLHWTFAIFGASVGLLQGTYHAAQRLQPHFTSTKGAKQLIYGVNHPEREQLSVTDLIKSWIPGYNSRGQKAIHGPGSYSKSNGYAMDHATAVQTDPTQTPVEPLTAKARDFTPKKMYEHYTSSGPTAKEGGAADEATLAPGTRTHSYEPEYHHSAHSDDTEVTDDDDHSVIGEGEDPNHHRKRKKAAKALKKAGHAIKTVFKIPIENSDKAHGGILPCTAPTATK